MKKLLVICFFLCASSAFASEQRSFNWFWFIYEREYCPSYTSFTVRPFYTNHVSPNLYFDASLIPVFFWRYITENKRQTKGFFGLYNSIDLTNSNGTEDHDLGIFPFIFYGHGNSDENRDNYFMLWPFGGQLNGKLSYEKVSAAIFPGFLLFVFFPPAQLFSITTTIYIGLSMLPLYSSWSRGEYSAFGIMWPIFMRGKSPERDDIRIMPFYAHKKKSGWYDRYSFLLLFNYSKEYYANDTRKTFFFFPFFGRKWSDSGRISSWTFLWPFFSWGYDKKQKSFMYNLPWPLVQIEDTEEPKISKRIFFPFYGAYSYEKNSTLFITPLFIKLSKKGIAFDSVYYTNFFIVWWHKRNYHTDDSQHGKSWRYFKIWPLFSVEYNDKNDFAFNTLSLLPLRDADGYEKLYEPLWSVLEYRRFAFGEKRLGILMRTYYQRWGENFFQCKIPFLFSYNRIMNKTAGISFLLSMFSYSAAEADGSFLRLFWIPFRVGEADAELLQQVSERGRADEKELWEMAAPAAMRSALCIRGEAPGNFYFSHGIF
ncbi:MAG: hypothetical protein LBT84_05825 [Spirochaetia bacterium]|nr:hypothetical protein [Spirochaetia bacterium]